MRKFLQYLLVGTLAMGALGGLAACSSKSKSDKAEDTVDQALKDNGGGVRSSGLSSEVPDDFPNDVPLPEDGDLTSSFSTDTGDAKRFTQLAYSYGNAGAVSDAADAYKLQLLDDGFDISSEIGSCTNGTVCTSFTASNDKYSRATGSGVEVNANSSAEADDASLIVTVTLASGN